MAIFSLYIIGCQKIAEVFELIRFQLIVAQGEQHAPIKNRRKFLKLHVNNTHCQLKTYPAVFKRFFDFNIEVQVLFWAPLHTTIPDYSRQA